MKISKTSKDIKCDTVLCGKDADYEIFSDSYKGTIYLCDNCFKMMQKLFKRVTTSNE